MDTLPAPCMTRYLTISRWPSKQAALRGVEFVRVVLLTLATCDSNNWTMFKWPAAAAHHRGGAPSIVSPSKITEKRNTICVLRRTCVSQLLGWKCLVVNDGKHHRMDKKWSIRKFVYRTSVCGHYCSSFKIWHVTGNWRVSPLTQN